VSSDYHFQWLSFEAKIHGKYLVFLLSNYIRLLQPYKIVLDSDVKYGCSYRFPPAALSQQHQGCKQGDSNKSGTKGPTLATMLATEGRHATAMTHAAAVTHAAIAMPSKSNSKDDINSMIATTATASNSSNESNNRTANSVEMPTTVLALAGTPTAAV
jgi:hypothetical protein